MQRQLVLSSVFLLLMGCGGAQLNTGTDPGLVALSASLGNAYVPADETSEVIARIRVSTDNRALSDREPVNVALVIDTSGSMQGVAIENARQGSLRMLELLSEDDYLSVVAFHSSAEVLLPSTRIGDSDMAQLRAQIGAMEAEGTTAMAEGLQVGIEEAMANLQPNGVNRVVLLGDGIPNTETNIIQLAQAAGERGISISAIGLGLEFHETLMGQVAQLSGGSFHYVEDPETIVAAFEVEALRVRQVFGRGAVITLQPGPGVQIDSVVGQNVTANGATVQVALGDLNQGEHRDLFVRATVQGRRDGASVELMDVGLAFQDATVEAGAIERSVYLGAEATSDGAAVETSANLEIIEQAERASAAAVTIEALTTARAGNIEEARAVLAAAESQLRNRAEQTNSAVMRSSADRLGSLSGALPQPAAPGAAPEFEDDESASEARQQYDMATDALGY